MTSNHHAPYDLGYTRATRRKQRKRECDKANPKITSQFDCSLQLDCTKLESLVIADQNAAVNTFPGLVHTARHTMESVTPEVSDRTERTELPKAGRMTGVKS